MDRIVQTRLYSQLEYFFNKLWREKEQICIDGVPAMTSSDVFLPGKVAIGLSYLLLNTAADDPQLASHLQRYREIADLTAGMDIQSWGIYYYLLALTQLQKGGLLERAISPNTLQLLKEKLDWRSFVNESDLTLIKLPTNYYGVAFSAARLRLMLGWEDESVANQLLDKTLEHYDRYSGEYGFSDETEGEGRFDRYSILLIAEICQRFVQTGMAVPLRLKKLLRRAADVTLNIANEGGHGFSFGRSIGPYGDSAAIEILSIAAYLEVLTPDEKLYAYSFATRSLAKYLEVWFDPKLHSVDMWGKGRRTDTYRAKHRILGENFSLLHQFISSNALWNDIGFQGRQPMPDLQAWLDRERPAFSLTWFAKGKYDRALAIFRDGADVFCLPLINGGTGQHDNSPYYPIPFADNIVAGIADSGAAHPQLCPKFLLADGSELIATSFIRRIKTEDADGLHRVSYEQDALNQLGRLAPVEDTRIQLSSCYEFAPGLITRIDCYTPATALQVTQLSLNFLSFSEGPRQDGPALLFEIGRVISFEVEGLQLAGADPIRRDHALDSFESPGGPMKTHLRYAKHGFTFDQPLTIRWSLKYR